MEEIELRCILHVGEGSNIGDIKGISETSWATIQSASKRRMSQKSSKYSEIIDNLPSVLSCVCGYNVPCYSNFTAIPKNDQVSQEENQTASMLITCSQIASSSKSSSHLLPELCLFCDKKRKKVKNKWEELGSCVSRDAEIAIREAAERKNNEVILLKLGRYK